MEEYPILIDGAQAGKLTVAQNGLMTIFNATAEDTGTLFRLSVYGGGKEAYLGVMCPENGRLRLTKRLSRVAMADFPQRIDYAGPSGDRQSAQQELISECGLKPEPEQTQEQVQETKLEEEAMHEDADTVWYSAPDGTLSTFDGRSLLVALPAEGVNMPKGSEGALRRINGREYIVFPR